MFPSKLKGRIKEKGNLEILLLHFRRYCSLLLQQIEWTILYWLIQTTLPLNSPMNFLLIIICSDVDLKRESSTLEQVVLNQS